MKELIKKQEEKLEELFEMIGGSQAKYYKNDIKTFIAKVRKETVKFERERIKKIIKDMPDTFPELESDNYDMAYQEAKRYMLEVIDITKSLNNKYEKRTKTDI